MTFDFVSYSPSLSFTVNIMFFITSDFSLYLFQSLSTHLVGHFYSSIVIVNEHFYDPAFLLYLGLNAQLILKCGVRLVHMCLQGYLCENKYKCV